MTPLHWAVEKRHPSLVTMLLKYGADAGLASKFLKTPIMLAIESKQHDVLQELISHNHMTICQQEQQEATDSLMYELGKDNNYDSSQHNESESDMIYTSTENSPAPVYHAPPVSNQKLQHNSEYIIFFVFLLI